MVTGEVVVVLAGRAAERVPVAVAVAVLFKAPVTEAVAVPFNPIEPVAVAVPFNPIEPVAVAVELAVAVEEAPSELVPLNRYKLTLHPFPHFSEGFPAQGMEQSPSGI